MDAQTPLCLYNPIVHHILTAKIKQFDFLGFDDGIVTVVLKGSCSGCPSSTATLKGGIENLLKQHLPEVQEVVAING
jgi:Fe-S cluster biogenesis protein NfuA